MEKDFKKYDEICATALSWVLWNKSQHQNEKFCITNINSSDIEDLWFLSVISCMGTITSSKIYVDTRFSDFLYLKYIKKYKFLKYNFPKENTFYLDAVLFKNELLAYFNESLSILGEIYNEYYRR